MKPDRARLAALAIACLAVGVLAIPAGADTGAAPGPASAIADATVDEAGASLAAQANNSTTVRHRNPDEAGEDGDLDDVQSWLAGRLGERLTEGTIHLSQGEYELARSVVDEEYRRDLGKYVDVAGETEAESDDRAAEEFERARDAQEEYATGVQEYRETRQEYEEAKEAGEETRARELARELDRIANEVNETGAELSESLRSVSNESGVDLADAERTVETTTENITEQQAAIRAEEFVETELNATARADRTSFSDPLAVTGRLAAENGTGLADRTVVLEIGNRTVATGNTDGDGEFSIEYRPTLAPTGNVTLTARFVPANDSVYLGTTDTVTTVVESVRPTIELSDHTERASYGDPVVASGTVGVDGVGAAGVPLVVEVGDVRIGAVETKRDGTFTFEGTLPAAADAGDRRLRVRLPWTDRALSGANASAPLSVTTTATTLTLDGAGIDGRTARIEGRLATDDGRALDDRSVAIAVNGAGVATVTTDPNGAFAANVTVPADEVANGESVTVLVSGEFDGSGTNLESADAETRIDVSPGSDQTAEARDGPFGFGIPWWGWLALAVAVAIGLGALYRRRDRESRPDDGPGPVGAVAPATTVESDSGPDTASLLELARDRLRGGSADEAVEVGYGAVRRRLEGALGLASPRTHWEFYRACRDADLDPDRIDALRRLTELYERAAFTPDPVPAEDAEDAIGAASDLASRAGTAPPSDD